MRDIILNSLTMEDVLFKYGIKTRNSMFSCPFHGEDKKPSAKAYKNSFFCFACTAHGDTISFVEKYFNLSFKEAMQKLNIDFNLGIDSNYKVDYNKINKIKNERIEKEKRKISLYKKFDNLCEQKRFWERETFFLQKCINTENIDRMIELQLEMQNKLMNIEYELEKVEKEMAAY